MTAPGTARTGAGDALAAAGPLAPAGTARRLVDASLSPNTRSAYASALRRLDARLDGRRLDDASLAAYLAGLHDDGRAAPSAAMAVAAARVLAGYRRTAGDRGRGQARPFSAADLAAVLATCRRPRRNRRGVESDRAAADRGRVDAVIAGLLFMAGIRRSEVSALRWDDLDEANDGCGILVAVRRSKTDQEGAGKDVRFVKDGVARAIRALRAATPPGNGRVAQLSHSAFAPTDPSERLSRTWLLPRLNEASGMRRAGVRDGRRRKGEAFEQLLEAGPSEPPLAPATKRPVPAATQLLVEPVHRMPVARQTVVEVVPAEHAAQPPVLDRSKPDV